MGTQGIVLIRQNGKMLYKIIAGCNGYKAPFLAKALRENQIVGIHKIHQLAKEHGFGCKDCLVTMDVHLTVIGLDTDDKELITRYMENFQSPAFNPRWGRGTAAYYELVKYQSSLRRVN